MSQGRYVGFDDVSGRKNTRIHLNISWFPFIKPDSSRVLHHSSWVCVEIERQARSVLPAVEPRIFR